MGASKPYLAALPNRSPEILQVAALQLKANEAPEQQQDPFAY